MIHISDKHNCCGCHACVSVCAHHSITMQADEEGFLYPVVDKETCTDCGLCEKACPVINQGSPRKPLKVYAAKNNDEEIRKQSSSGGIFTLLAEAVIKDGGIVFGAKFDKEWNVVHDWSDTIEGIAAFRGSKYVQSTIGNTYSEAREFLKQGRKVLFSGTPCQIAGLKKFLRKEYDNLLTVDVVCHGVPSPKVWQRYLKDLNSNNSAITDVCFRSKKRGWKNYSYLIQSQKSVLFDDYAYKSDFLQAFSLNLSIRPSCYICPSKNLKSESDITLADCWGIEKIAEDDNAGFSTILLNTDKALLFCQDLDVCSKDIDYSFVVDNNKSISYSAHEPYCRKLFWNLFPNEGLSAAQIIKRRLTNNIFFRIYNKIRTHFIYIKNR